MRTKIVNGVEVTAKKGLLARNYFPNEKHKKVTYQVVIEVETDTRLTAKNVDASISAEIGDVGQYVTFFGDTVDVEVPVKVKILKAKVKGARR